jgi:hypothetical protein
LLLKCAQFAFIFSTPLSCAVQWSHYELVSRENLLRFLAGIRDFSFYKRIQTSSGTYPDPHSIKVRCTFPHDKADGAWRWLSTCLLPKLSGATHLLP